MYHDVHCPTDLLVGGVALLLVLCPVRLLALGLVLGGALLLVRGLVLGLVAGGALLLVRGAALLRSIVVWTSLVKPLYIIVQGVLQNFIRFVFCYFVSFYTHQKCKMLEVATLTSIISAISESILDE